MKNIKKVNKFVEELNLIDTKLREIDKAATKIIKEDKEITLFMECEKTPEKSDIIDSDGSLVNQTQATPFGFRFSFPTDNEFKEKEQLINQVVTQEQILEIFGVIIEPLVTRREEIINSLKQLGVHA